MIADMAKVGYLVSDSLNHLFLHKNKMHL